MKKILVAFDGSRYSESALNYAIKLNPSGDNLIVGLFIEDLSYAYMFTNFAVDPMGHELTSAYSTYIEEVRSREEAVLAKNRQAFIDRCEEAGVRYTTHTEEGETSQRLIEESVFADLLVTGYQVYFSNLGEANDQKVLKDILAEAHCPVLVVPEEDQKLEEVIFTYDGGRESVYAIKQFTNLLARAISAKSYELLSFQNNKDAGLPYESLIREYLHQHYPEVTYHIEEGNPKEALPNYIAGRPHSLIVMGSFGRNALSRLFSTSKAQGLLANKSIPVFIAHH